MATINQRLLHLRRRELLRRLGADARGMREDAGRSQAAIARAGGISKAYLSAIEAGEAEPSLEVLMRVATALGGDLGVRFFAGSGPPIRDRSQVAMTEALLAALHPRWRSTPEVAVYRPIRGVIDVVLEDRAGPDTVGTEIQSQLRRVEQQVRWQSQKVDGLRAQPDQAGRRTSPLLVLRNTTTMRDVVSASETMLMAAYPGRTCDAVGALRGIDRWPGAAMIWMTLEHGIARLLDGPPRGVLVGR